MNGVQWENRLAEFRAAATRAPAQAKPKQDWAQLIESKRGEVLGKTHQRQSQSASVASAKQTQKAEGAEIQNRWAMQGYIKSTSELNFNTESPKNSDNNKRILGNYLDLVV